MRRRATFVAPWEAAVDTLFFLEMGDGILNRGAYDVLRTPKRLAWMSQGPNKNPIFATAPKCAGILELKQALRQNATLLTCPDLFNMVDKIERSIPSAHEKAIKQISVVCVNDWVRVIRHRLIVIEVFENNIFEIKNPVVSAYVQQIENIVDIIIYLVSNIFFPANAADDVAKLATYERESA